MGKRQGLRNRRWNLNLMQTPIEVRVRSGNSRAIRMYKNLGFKRKRPLIWDPFDYLVMQLRVS